jgi:hypothetical protein
MARYPGYAAVGHLRGEQYRCQRRPNRPTLTRIAGPQLQARRSSVPVPTQQHSRRRASPYRGAHRYSLTRLVATRRPDFGAYSAKSGTRRTNARGSRPHRLQRRLLKGHHQAPPTAKVLVKAISPPRPIGKPRASDTTPIGLTSGCPLGDAETLAIARTQRQTTSPWQVNRWSCLRDAACLT